MKNIILILLSGFYYACTCYPYIFKDYVIGEVYTTPVGSPILTSKYGCAVIPKDTTKRPTSGYCQELVYSGRSQNTIYLLYREYEIARQGDFIRSAYTTSYVYDITNTQLITFRNFRLNVMDANSNQIKFSVVSDGIQRGANLITIYTKDGGVHQGPLKQLIKGEAIYILDSKGDLIKFEWAEIDRYEE